MTRVSNRQVKDLLYEQVSRIGKAASAPRRLEFLEVLSQGEKTVEALAEATGISVKLASAHLKALRASRLVEARRDGKHMHYRLSDSRVADFWVALRALAEEQLVELQLAMKQLVSHPAELSPIGGRALMAQAKRGSVVVIDVRPEPEYRSGHLPFARSIPLTELRARLAEIPRGKPVVAYCRGPFCLMARDAVALMAKSGLKASRLEDGVAEWRSRGLPLHEEA
jgi:DNA-binding transcriptional ArsR family regulator/rhodanese-related sulfurtransferase